MRSELVQGRTQWKRWLHSQELHRNETTSVSRALVIGSLDLTFAHPLRQEEGFLLNTLQSVPYQVYQNVSLDKGQLLSCISGYIAGYFWKLFQWLLWCFAVGSDRLILGLRHKSAENSLVESCHHHCPRKKPDCVLVMI